MGVIRPKALIISDPELNCDCAGLSIDDLNISHLGFSVSVVEGYDLIIYSGTKGDKILKSKYTKTGKII